MDHDWIVSDERRDANVEPMLPSLKNSVRVDRGEKRKTEEEFALKYCPLGKENQLCLAFFARLSCTFGRQKGITEGITAA